LTLPFQETHASTPIRVLIVEDSPEVARVLVETLRSGGYSPVFQRVDTAEDYDEALGLHGWDVIFSDHSMGRFNSINALQIARDRGLRMPFIVISGAAEEDVSRSVMQAGANDFIRKDELERLVPVVARELGEVSGREERRRMQAAFRQSEERFRLFYDPSPIAYQTLDAEGCVIDVNPAWARLIGFPAEEVIGRWFGSFMTREGAESFRRDLRELMNSGTSRKEYVLVSHDARHLKVIACGQVGYCNHGRSDAKAWVWFEHMLLPVVE
jgi:PAS domain S-box-containing protein